MRKTSLKTMALSIAIAMALTSCGAVMPAGFMAASRLDPLTTPPGDIAFAVEVPQALRLSDGDAELRLQLVDDQNAEEVWVDETVPLQISPATEALLSGARDDRALYLATLSARDAETISSAQKQILDIRAQGQQGRGSLSIQVVGGCLETERLDTLPVSTWLRTDPDADFVQLTRQRDVFDSLDAAQRRALQDGLRLCAS
ncbi:MAG: hypothetical protein AAF686_06225 [Pseudomonadota bacterium]